MRYSALELCRIPWQMEPNSKIIKSHLKRIRSAQLKLTRKGDKLIGLDFVPIVRAKQLLIKKNRELQRVEIERQNRIHEATDWINKKIKLGHPINPKALLKMHSILTGSKESSFRKQSIYLKDLKGKRLAEFPDVKILSQLMREFWSWNNRTSQLPFLLKAIGAHFLLANIHPFQDGNGRLARFFEYYEIARNSLENASYFSSELICYWRFSEYSKSISKSIEVNSMNPFIEYSLLEQALLLEDLICQTQ